MQSYWIIRCLLLVTRQQQRVEIHPRYQVCQILNRPVILEGKSEWLLDYLFNKQNLFFFKKCKAQEGENRKGRAGDEMILDRNSFLSETRLGSFVEALESCQDHDPGC